MIRKLSWTNKEVNTKILLTSTWKWISLIRNLNKKCMLMDNKIGIKIKKNPTENKVPEAIKVFLILTINMTMEKVPLALCTQINITEHINM